MVNKLLLSIRLRIVRALVLLIIVICIVAWLDKMFKFSGRDKPAASFVESTQASSVHRAPKNAFAEQEKNREELLATQSDKKLIKTNLTQKISDECQFWTLQKKKGTSALAGTKVKQYCKTPINK